MLKKTHTQGGFLLGLITIPALLRLLPGGINRVYVLIILIAYLLGSYIGSVVPDIDMKGSSISRQLPLLYYLIGRRYKHRGFTHSLLFIFMLSVGSIFIIKVSGADMIVSIFMSGVVMGCVSHIVLDILTIEGVELFYPCKKRISLLALNTGQKKEQLVNKILTVFIYIFIGMNIREIIVFMLGSFR